MSLTFLLENICNELDDERSGEKINSVSVVILVSFDKVIKTESRRQTSPSVHEDQPNQHRRTISVQTELNYILEKKKCGEHDGVDHAFSLDPG